MKGSFRTIISIVLIIIVIASVLSGCSRNKGDEKLAADISQRFIEVADHISFTDKYDYSVFVDSETKVMYLVIYGGYRAGITVILNADGTPMLYDGDL